MDQSRGWDAGAAPEIVDRGEGPVGARGDDGAAMGVGETPDHAQAEAHREAAVVLGRLQRAIPARGVDANRPHIDSMRDRVPDDLGRRIKAHGLSVQQRRAEHIRMPAFQPGAGISDERERGRVRFRKAVRAEAFELTKGLLGEVALIAAVDHPFDQLLLESGDAAGEFERGHGFAQHVGFAGREAGAFDRHAHGLFLKERDAQGLAEHFFELWLREDDGLQPFPAAQIGVDHVSLDRSRPDDRDLHDEIVEGPRLQPRQHRHLRAGFDLKGSERVGAPDHRIGARVLGRDGGEIEMDSFVIGEHVEATLHAAQHSESQHVDLHELQGVDVVLVPFDHLPRVHRRRLDRDQLVEPVLREHESAGMLRQMPGRPHELTREVDR